jgi:hypothetical protein
LVSNLAEEYCDNFFLLLFFDFHSFSPFDVSDQLSSTIFACHNGCFLDRSK